MKNLAVSMLGALMLSVFAAGAQATTVAIATDGSWNAFDVDSISATSGGLEWIDNFTGVPQYQGNGSALAFTFTLTSQALLKVVDGAFAGDAFEVFNGGSSLGFTSAVPGTAYEESPPNASSYDAAFADHAYFSYLSLLLGPGTYTITGILTQSVTLDGAPLNATSGALSVTPVPVPAALPLLLSGLGLLGGSLKRRRLMPA